MDELLSTIADIRQQANKLRRLIVALAPEETVEIRRALSSLQTAIYVMERTTADARRAKEAL